MTEQLRDAAPVVMILGNLYKLGFSIQEAGKIVGMNFSTARRRLVAAGIRIRDRRPIIHGTSITAEQLHAFRVVIASGRSVQVCERCGGRARFRGRKRLDIHHKDRNRKNAHPSNLEVLCIVCHIAEHKNGQ